LKRSFFKAEHQASGQLSLFEEPAQCDQSSPPRNPEFFDLSEGQKQSARRLFDKSRLLVHACFNKKEDLAR
jgi:hypothetical protein